MCPGGAGTHLSLTSDVMGSGKGPQRRARERGGSCLGSQALPVRWACEAGAAWSPVGLEEDISGTRREAGTREQGGFGCEKEAVGEGKQRVTSGKRDDMLGQGCKGGGGGVGLQGQGRSRRDSDTSAH